MPRKNPYSGKQKKQQLKDKKARKQDGPQYLADWSDDDEPKPSDDKSNGERGASGGRMKVSDSHDVQKINAQPGLDSKVSVKSFRIHFLKETDSVINKRKKEARRPINYLHENDLEYSLQDVYPSHVNLHFPKRPCWNYDLTKEELETQERQYFKDYLDKMLSQPHAQDLSFFELNLENWRQLWRVIEISDILLIIADIRYPVLHISPSLINYVRGTLHKPVIIVLNKIDFVPPVLAVSWKRYFQSLYPDIHVVFFSSFVKKCGSVDRDLPLDFDTSKAIFHKPPKGTTSPLGPAGLYKAVLHIVKDKVDLSSWKQLLEENGMPSTSLSSEASTLEKPYQSSAASEVCSDGSIEGIQVDENNSHERQTMDRKESYKDGILTIGCIGYPNVGKSSVLNALKGKKVVSVSQTPGHTKHLQTIFLSPTVKLCDCPGLVFPSVVPKALQVIAGIFPVAQAREPYSVVQYIAERIKLPTILKIRSPNSSNKTHEHGDEEHDWSAYDICEAWALKCGFVTPKAGRPDLYRAANKILRMAVEGQLRLCFRPPQYSDNLNDLKTDPESLALHSLLMSGTQATGGQDRHEEEDDSEDDNDESIDEEGDGNDEGT